MFVRYFTALVGSLTSKSGAVRMLESLVLMNASEYLESPTHKNNGAAVHHRSHIARGNESIVIRVESPRTIAANPFVADVADIANLTSSKVSLLASLAAAGATATIVMGSATPAHTTALAALLAPAPVPPTTPAPVKSRKRTPAPVADDASTPAPAPVADPVLLATAADYDRALMARQITRREYRSLMAALPVK